MSREAGRLLLACVSAALLIVAVLQGLSWYWLSQSGQYVERLAARGWIEDESAWHHQREALLARQPLAPLDYRFFWQLGELHRWRAAGMYLWPDQQQKELESAKREYRKALIRSPHNGVLLAHTAHRLASANDRLAIPLMGRAMEIAPYEPVAQYHLSEVGLRFWDELDDRTRRSFKLMLSSAMENPRLAGEIRRMAKRHGRLDVVTASDGRSG